MSRLLEVNPHKSDVVRIKFKSINEIIANSGMSYGDAEDLYEIADNFRAYLSGGDFLVSESYEKEDGDDKGYIVLKNHLDLSHHFRVYDNAIESIEIVQDSEKFLSIDHKLLVVRVDNEMYINGVPMIWNEAANEKDFNRRKHNADKEYENPNRKLLKIFENYIADLAVRESFKDGGR